MGELQAHTFTLLLAIVFHEGLTSRVLRFVTGVHEALAPSEAGGDLSWGPRRAFGVGGAVGRGVPAFEQFHPFLFLEDALLPRGQMPPFGKHPHEGLCSITILFEGDHIQPWDSFNGNCPMVESGGMYILHSGMGIVHTEENCIPNAKDHSEFTHACFLWFDPGLWDPLPLLAHTQILQPHHIPEIKEGGLRVRVLLGEYRHVSSLADTHHARLLLLDCHLAPGPTQHVLTLPPAAGSAFVYVPWNGGEGEFGAGRVRITALHLGHVAGQGRALTVKNVGAGPLHCLVGAGESRGAAPHVMLGHNGAVAKPTEEEARKALQRFALDPEKFGAITEHIREPSPSSSPDPAPESSSSHSASPARLP